MIDDAEVKVFGVGLDGYIEIVDSLYELLDEYQTVTITWENRNGQLVTEVVDNPWFDVCKAIANGSKVYVDCWASLFVERGEPDLSPDWLEDFAEDDFDYLFPPELDYDDGYVEYEVVDLEDADMIELKYNGNSIVLYTWRHGKDVKNSLLPKLRELSRARGLLVRCYIWMAGYIVF